MFKLLLCSNIFVEYYFIFWVFFYIYLGYIIRNYCWVEDDVEEIIKEVVLRRYFVIWLW